MSYVKISAKDRYGASASVAMSDNLLLTIRDEDIILRNGEYTAFNVDSSIIVSMEVSRDILVVMEEELRKVPFDVTCPENEAFNAEVALAAQSQFNGDDHEEH